MSSLLQSIDTPSDLRRLERAQLPALAEELRQYLLESVSKTGGHLSSNLGTVELTIALHFVFDTPEEGVAPGQACVIYAAPDGASVLGGGFISATVSAA